MKHLKYINEAVGSIDERRAVNESTAKNVLKDAINALTKTFAGKKLDKSYVKDYLASIERMARKKPMDFVKDYMNFSNEDWIEDVEYNMANENTNEAINLDKIFMKGKSHPITDASTMKEIKKIYPKAKKTSDVHGAVFYIELAKDLYAKAFSENTFKSEEPFKIEAIYRMKGNKQHFLYQESVNEAAPKMKNSPFVEKVRTQLQILSGIEAQMKYEDSNGYSRCKGDFSKAKKALEKLSDSIRTHGKNY